MFDSLRLKLRVYYRTCEVDKARVSSFRWLGFGWDSYRSSQGYHFIQWGKKLPLRFIVRLPKEAPVLPQFVLAHSWKRLYSSRRLVFGHTKKPYPFGRYWRTQHANNIRTRLSRQGRPDLRLG